MLLNPLVPNFTTLAPSPHRFRGASQAKPEKICYFPGTFNPVHNGHIAMALAAARQFKFDQVVFIPAYQSPFKMNTGVAPFAERYEMLRRACEQYPVLTVSDIERQIGEKDPENPTYTINTVKEILKSNPGPQKINLIIGEAIDHLPAWKNAKELVSTVDFIVADRNNYNHPSTLRKIYNFLLKAPLLRRVTHRLNPLPDHLMIDGEPVKIRAKRLDMERVDASSTMVRDGVRDGQSIRNLVPEAVADYIENHPTLYRA